ncbi:Glucan endo-1,3-alpha-glucosidase agn1 [Elsinoe australis]|uniref:Glucan endo-1,3-alpha-glucosidase agn1 n=1 Tax=Elsinoe australis TaxID=40998 RepID=A0A2P8AFT5_9PEZI|nr:Glucan endo-1,3-alpha-glucosidase agn1 [Elsinoe australis]
MDDGEPTVLEYARSHGLSRDFSAASPFDELELPELETNHSDGDNQLPPILKSDLSVPHDKWCIRSSTAAFLKECLLPVEQEPQHTLLPKNFARGLKLELPVLSQDEDLEFRRFIVRKVREPQLEQNLRPLTPESLPDDSRFDWPLLDAGLVKRVSKQVASEKWQITAGSLGLLREAALPTKPDSAEGSDYFRPSRLRIPSPVLPLSPVLTVSSPKDEDLEVPFASTPTDPAIVQLEAVNNIILHDQIEPVAGIDSTSRFFDPTYIDPDAQNENSYRTPSPSKRPLPEDFKMDVPLTPFEDLSPPFKKVRFHEIIPEDDPTYRPSSSDSAAYEAFFDSVMDVAGPAILAVEHEQLEEADATLRMTVPLLLDYRPTPPWELFARSDRQPSSVVEGCNPQCELLHEVYTCLKSNEIKWPSNHNTTNLRWDPVPYLRCKDVVKDYISSEALSELLDHLSINDQRMERYFWKAEGLRILDVADDDDNHLESAPFDAHEVDISSLVQQKRNGFDGSTSDFRLRALRALEEQETSLSTTNALDSFFHLQTGQTSERPPTRGKASSIPGHMPKQFATAVNPPPNTSPLPNHHRPALPFPTPPIDSTTAPPQIIIATSLLTNRPLLSSLHSHLPTTDFIPRELPDTQETDILPSPTTGLLLTTLQKLKQRPLPGTQTSEASSGYSNAVHTRLTSLSARYENLVVLVSEALPVPKKGGPEPIPRALDGSDAAALNGLVNLGASLGCEVKVVYVPGSEREMGKWVASEICRASWSEVGHRYGGNIGEWVGEEETPQEGFLRRAGMNACAAAVVVSKGKRSERDRGEGCLRLAEFVLLGAEGRREVWGPLLGTRVVDRVGRALDQTWSAVGAVTSRVDDVHDQEFEEMLF